MSPNFSRSRWVVLALLVTACVRSAPGTAPPGVSAEELEGVLGFHALRSTTGDASIRARAGYRIATVLERQGLPFSASLVHAQILKAHPPHPFQLPAVEALVRLQRTLDDGLLIPRLLNNEYSEAWATLSIQLLARLNFGIGVIAFRREKLTQAREFSLAVPINSPVHAKALYLEGIALADPRFPEGARAHDALAALQRILSLDTGQEDLGDLQGLASLALGRVAYGMQRYPQAVSWYSRAQQSAPHRATAIYEGAFAQLAGGDEAGALAALRSPEVARGFFPEAAVLEATIHHRAGRQPEAKAALDGHRRYEQLSADLRRRLQRPRVSGEAAALLKGGGEEVRSNRRMMSSLGLIDQALGEEARVAEIEAWRGTEWASELITALRQQREELVKAADDFAIRRLQQLAASVDAATRLAAIVRLEIALGQLGRAGPGAARFDPPIEVLAGLISTAPAGSAETPALLFQLADLTWQKALAADRSAATPLLTEALRLNESVLTGHPRYERADEVLFACGNLKEQLGDPAAARLLYLRLIQEFPRSGLAREATARGELIGKSSD